MRRRLLYVPIIHDEVDMGSAGASLSQNSAALSGEQRWIEHQKAVRAFWENLSSCLESFNPAELKIYQDGMVAEGDVARRIVEEAADRRSSNYRLVIELLNQGAEIRKTEDIDLLLQEHEIVRKFILQGHSQRNWRDAEQYQIERDRLTAERDTFIAGAINATLQEGETGVLFIGAYHDVASRLAPDISVEMVKSPQKLMAYVYETFSGHDNEKLDALRSYLSAPISI